MKRGKDEEKTMGPMFPRLHVNDTEKGGPRAPPRNKMALYEQLSIPSQRFNTGLLALNPNNSNNLNFPSSSQGSGHERGVFFPHQLPPSVHPAEKTTRHADLNPTLVQIEPKKRQEEEDFMVPIFVQFNKRQDHSKNNNSVVKERRSPFSSADSDHFVKFQNTSEKEPKQLDTSGLNLRQGDIRQSEDNSKEFVALRETSNNFDSNKSFREKSESTLKQIHASSSFKHMDNPPNYFHRLNGTNDCLQCEYRENSQPTKSLRGDGASIDHSRDMDHRNSSILMGDLQQEEQRSPNTPTNDAESCEDTCRSLQTGILDRDDASETSMVDSMSGTDLSPDDAVGIIGQKHFWKARRAIVNQQRVFAVQVFELHRLIKVQRLIAESPHILLEDDAYLEKPLKGAPEKKIPLDYIVKNTPKIVKHKDFSEKPDNRMESSAENAVEKTSLSSLQNGSQPSSYGPFLGNPHPTTVNSDPKMGFWGFNQPSSGHQWLVPVMTPFEGLVYKPYPGPGFMGPVYGHPGSTPLMGNYLNYGVPIPHHPYQGLGPASFAHPAGHGYFPPFSMPVMHPSSAGSADYTDHFNVPYQASCNMPSQKKNGAVPNAVKLNPSKHSEVQVSTASSPSSQRTRRTNVAHTSMGRLPLFPPSPVVNVPDGGVPLFPTSPVVKVPDGGVEQPTRVVKVVPHNARSATESVARIFQSIQEERRQYD